MVCDDLNKSGCDCIFVYKNEVFTSKNSYVDFAVSYITSNLEDETICCEIKISEDDFNSKYGSNFYGTQNYYVVPKYLANFVLDKIDNNALYNNIGLIEMDISEDGEHVYLNHKRWSKNFIENDVTRFIRNNLISSGTYIGKGNSELKRNTFNFFHNCNKYENQELLANMIKTSKST